MEMDESSEHEMGSGTAHNQPCSQFPSAISAEPGMSTYTSGWEFLCYQRAGLDVFQCHKAQAVLSSPLHHWP